MNCSICFCDIEKNYIDCIDKDCKTKTCYSCIETYIEISYKERMMLKCPRHKCEYPILFSSIKKFEYKFIQMYKEICINILNSKFNSKIKNNEYNRQILEKVKNDRLDFINKLPSSISFVINTALKDKLKKVIKSNQKIIQIREYNNKNRVCLNLLCDGIIEKNQNKLECIKCKSIFCINCENEMKDEHICDENDIQSILFLRSCVSCPNCNYKVVKSEGCNDITCPICKVNFNYINGSISKHGNHDNTTFKYNKVKNLSYILENDDKYNSEEIKDMILKIEKCQPKEYDTDKIIKILEKNEDNIPKEYEKFILYQYKYIKYYKIITEIKKLHSNTQLNMDKLNKLYIQVINI